MRKIVFHLETGYCGMETDVAYLVPDNVTDTELDDRVYWEAVEHASSYGIYPPSEDEDEDDLEYSGDNIEGSWRIYTPEDDCKLLYGTNSTIQWNAF